MFPEILAPYPVPTTKKKVAHCVKVMLFLSFMALALMNPKTAALPLSRLALSKKQNCLSLLNLSIGCEKENVEQAKKPPLLTVNRPLEQ